MKCKICNTDSDKYLDSTIFKEKISISYFKCQNCDFIQTEEAYWLDKAYSSAITKSDIGLVYRNLSNAEWIEKIVLSLMPHVKTCLDYAGGYGMYVRLMRDKGFDFYWQDDYCENIFAQHFIGSLDTNYDVVTAFEVFEHLPNPLKTIELLLNKANYLFFTTTTTDDIKDVVDFNNWWYRGEASGQHISFYSTKNLQYIADKHKVYYYSYNNGGMHLFSKQKIDSNLVATFNEDKKKSVLTNLNNKFFGQKELQIRESLLQSDYNKIISNELNS